ncbi:Rrf2 family transcriptional regulator [Pseudomonas sp. 21TX0197]|uniref:Rrf2 family transcriptional regulator n=1 Tax=Pseudomonas TaxID=286 RepID=UPI00090860FC|nr:MULTISPECIES: Rrf2 family transcriptional regulator [Pseudomonas]MDB6442721.1 Rrf2 family transcriptional regulator [Pseudomonas sp. 21TX0197]NHN68400.1 Rrf2 family transcriptional regulator [Pseudomonas fluorescens]SFW46304.1 DNA-binding transcriptional regulator, IscR family [Pseudomonas sp. NFACC09-4]
MRNDTRLSRMLHVLIHMDRHQQSATSDTIAQMLGTNPVVVRRTMALLKEQGYVTSEKGHRGGWTLSKPLSEMTLLDIHQALGNTTIFAIGLSTDHPRCLVEQAVNAALTDAFDEAQALLLKRLGSITLAQLAEDFDQRFREGCGAGTDGLSPVERNGH